MLKQSGVTLLEMLITIAIVAIVLTSVAPAMQTMLIQNRIVADTNELSSIIQYARHHSIDQQVDTLVCPSDNFTSCSADWNDVKMVFADIDGNGVRGTDEDILVATSATNPNNQVAGTAASLRFEASGAVDNPAVITLCHKDKVVKYARALIVSLQGRVKISRDDNDDGLHEDITGNALTCS